MLTIRRSKLYILFKKIRKRFFDLGIILIFLFIIATGLAFWTFVSIIIYHLIRAALFN